MIADRLFAVLVAVIFAAAIIYAAFGIASDANNANNHSRPKKATQIEEKAPKESAFNTDEYNIYFL